MMSSEFITQTHGKSIIAGEHAVLRNQPAIVYPVLCKTLELRYQHSEQNAHAEFSGDCGEDIHLLFWGVLEHGLEIVNHSVTELTGTFYLNNTIPIGVGMGVSAALCAAVGRWFFWRGLVSENDVFEFSRRLENLFHNESSGVDIAGTLADQAIFYSRDGTHEVVEQNWQPNWYLSHSDQIGITGHCVKKVKELLARNPELGNRIDEDMRDSVLAVKEALSLSADAGLTLLASAINKAKLCFTQWGLAGGKVEQHINQLLQQGALAAKPTGSGDGGYVLSLWAEPIESSNTEQFIAL